MRVAEAIRSLSSVPPLLRTIDNIPETASPAELVDISLSCPAIQSQQIRSEFLELAKMVKEQRCKYIMEIGTYRGGTLFVFSQLADPRATVISLDFHFSFLARSTELSKSRYCASSCATESRSSFFAKIRTCPRQRV